MANGDYWNVGRRRGIYTGGSSLDILDKILGITGNIAQSTQDDRDRRSGRMLVEIADLTGYSSEGGQPEYKKTLNNTILTEMLDTMTSEDFSKRIQRSNLEAQQAGSLVIKDLTEEIQKNEKYVIEKAKFQATEDDFLSLVTKYHANQNTYNDEQKKDLLESMITIAGGFKRDSINFLNDYKDKLGLDPTTAASINTMNNYSKQFLYDLEYGEYKGKISDKVLNAVREGLMTDDDQPWKDLERLQTEGKHGEVKVLINSYNTENEVLANLELDLLQYEADSELTGDPLDVDVITDMKTAINDAKVNIGVIKDNFKRHTGRDMVETEGKTKEEFKADFSIWLNENRPDVVDGNMTYADSLDFYNSIIGFIDVYPTSDANKDAARKNVKKPVFGKEKTDTPKVSKPNEKRYLHYKKKNLDPSNEKWYNEEEAALFGWTDSKKTWNP